MFEEPNLNLCLQFITLTKRLERNIRKENSVFKTKTIYAVKPYTIK